MNVSPLPLAIVVGCLCLSVAGCHDAPGNPKLEVAALRPDQVHDFSTLYKQNCSACHGENGKGGVAISLANPVYLATAGAENIHRVTAAGVQGTLMPVFARSAGGTLTETQVSILTRGMIERWGKSSAHLTALPYASRTPGSAAQGQLAYATFCASCHGVHGEGVITKDRQTGSIVDPAYLALISDQGLRSILIAGMPDAGMPDFRSDLATTASRAMTDQEVTDTVAWMTSFRAAAPLQATSQPAGATQDERRTTHE